jgi:NTP pyrophosphatase (non-canonical NTP hydrolase)
MINNKDLKISEMIELSYKLWEKNKEKWSPMEPKYGKDFILYMIEEVGEVIEIIKKKSEEEIMNDDLIRERFIEELGDVLMYFIDVLNRFDISAEEFSEIYIEKYRANLGRDFEKQHKEF